MKKVLIISYEYPPRKTIGSLRLAKWAKYLPSFGWMPVVVTVKPRTNMYIQYGSLPDELRTGRVYRTRDWSLNEMVYLLSLRWGHLSVPTLKYIRLKKGRGKLFSKTKRQFFRMAYWVYRQIMCFPDECWPWLIEYPKIERIAQKERPDIILSSSLPNTSHLLASRLSRRLGLPWVADFRDLWTQNHVLDRFFPLHSLEVMIERRTIQPASALITVSEILKQQLLHLHSKPVYVITNGFDPDDFPDELVHFNPDAPLRIVYTGTIYPGKRDPSPLFVALQTLLKRRVIGPEDIRVDFYGRKLDIVEDLLDRYSLIRPLVRLMGEIPYKEALRVQRSADILLLLEWVDPKAQGVYTGKVFEYLGARRPILSIGPAGGVLEALLEETKAGVHVQSPEEIILWIRSWIAEKRRFGCPPFSGNIEAIQRYTRKEQARKLAHILDKFAAPCG